MSLFISAENTFLTNVKAAPTATPAPTHARPGTLITVTLAGFSTTLPPGIDTTCTISGTPVSNPSSCSITAGAGTVTFTVAHYTPAGTYTITVTGSPAGDSAQFSFTVDGFTLILTPTSGSTGTEVRFTITGVPTTDTACSVSGQPSGVVTFAACSVSSGIGNGTFIVGYVPPGDYVIEITACTGNVGCAPSAGDFAQQVFTVTSGPSIVLIPSKGPTGTHVIVNGTGFLPWDTTCTISSPSSGSIIVNAACAIVPPIGSPPQPSNKTTGSFYVGNVPIGQYVIRVTGSPGGDFAEAVFNVNGTRGPQLILIPAKGPTGTHVNIEGGFFSSSDTTCSISSPSSGSVIQGAGCAVTAGSGFGAGLGNNVTGSFIVGNVPEGQYVIRVTGSPVGDFAEAVFNVTRGPFIQLSGITGGFASVGRTASGPVGTHVNVEGSFFLSTDTTCTLSSPSSGTILQGAACSTFKVSSGPFLGYMNVTGSFIVGNVPQGQYVIRVTGNQGDFAEAIFNVTRGAFIQLSGITGGFASVGRTASGPVGTHVNVEGSSFLSTDTTCTLSSPSFGTILQGAACSVFKVQSGPFLGYMNVTGSFIVGNVPEGQYVIQVTGNAGDFAQAIFNVTRGAFIQLFPAGGIIGTHVNVTGSFFLSTDTTCSISSPSSGTILLGAACSVFKVSSGPFFGYQNVTGSFIVGNVLPGQYVVRVTGNQGDFAEAIFTVTFGPKISLSPGSGRIGIHVLVNGTGFLPQDNTCTITGPGSGIITAAACSIQLGTGTPGGSFTVGNVLPGQYVIQVTGNQGDFAQAVFNVTIGPKITLIPPTTSPPGTHIQVSGTGFLPTDTACVVSSPGSNAVLGGSQACVIQAGTGVVNASFTIGNVLPGQYLIQVTGNQGDFAQALLNVASGPSLTLSQGTGTIGTHISVNGTGFLPTDQSCTVSSVGSFNPILPGSSACVVTVGTGIVRGSFIIGNVPPGQYVIEVTGCQGNLACTPSVGDFAQAILNVVGGPATLSLFPTNATNGVTVTFRAYGLSPTDTGCIVESVVETAPGVYTPNTILITSPTCSVVSPQVAQGSFVVGPYATTNINWTVQIRGTPVNDIPARAVFNVTASVNVTPPTGTINTVFTYTGSGFSSAASSCTATIIPPFPSGANPGCYLSAQIGQVSGSIVAPLNTPPGTYAVRVVDNTGKAATGVFTVGTPSAFIQFDPASVAQGQPVGVAGIGFNPNDTYCVITAGTPSQLFASTPNCAISGGYVSGAFTVSPNAPGGYYLVTVTGYFPAGGNLTRGDFASNFLGVNLASTITTFSTTTSSATTTTSQTTTTTSVATSFSFSSTTYSTTGILFTTYSQFTITTVSAPTTTTATQTTSTTMTQSTVTITTTTAFTTVSCGPLPCGFVVGSQSINPSPLPDSIGLLAVLLLILPMLLRRLFT